MMIMNTYVKFIGDINKESTSYLEKLADLIKRDCGISTKIEREGPIPGRKGFGLAFGLVLTDISLSTIDILVNAIAFWYSLSPQYSAQPESVWFFGINITITA